MPRPTPRISFEDFTKRSGGVDRWRLDQAAAAEIQRDAHWERNQEILDRAESEGRDLLASEARESDRCIAEVEAFTEAVTSWSDHNLTDARGPLEAIARAREVAQDSGGATLRGNPGGGTGRRRAVDGRGEVRAGRPLPEGRSFAEVLEVEAQPGSFGEYLRALAFDDNETLEEFRAMGRGGAGGMLPVQVIADVFDAARDASQLMNAGAQVIPLTEGQTKGAAIASEPTPSWRAENAQIPEADVTLVPIEFDPKALAVNTRVSWELLQDSRPNVEQLLRRVFAEAFAQEWDRVGLLGSGIGSEPRGLDNTPGVEEFLVGGAGGGPINYAEMVAAVRNIKQRNHRPGRFLGAPRDVAELAMLTDTTGQFLRPPAYLDPHLPVLETTKVATNGGTGENESKMWVGEWPLLVFGVRLNLEIRVLKDRYADYGQVGFTGFFRGDVEVIRPAAFEKLTGIVPPAPPVG